MTDDELKAIKARLEHVTAGPWSSDDYRVYKGEDGINGRYVDTCLIDAKHQSFYNERTRAEADQCADMAFIAHARTDVPQLVAEVETLKLMVEDLSTERDAVKVAAKVARRERDAALRQDREQFEFAVAGLGLVDASSWDDVHHAIDRHRSLLAEAIPQFEWLMSERDTYDLEENGCPALLRKLKAL